MRITRRALRQIIREELAGRVEFERAEEIYSEMIMGALRDHRGNVPALQAAMSAIPAQVLDRTGWSVEEIKAGTEQETLKRIRALRGAH